MKNKSQPFKLFAASMVVTMSSSAIAQDHLVFNPSKGDGNGKHVVLLAGDEEYRSEESMPMMAQVLANQGFKCTVLFSMDKDNKFVDPTNQQSLSNPQSLDSADVIVMSLRFRNWNDAAFEKFNAAFERGVPMVALRTSTHAFNTPADGKWAKFSYNAKPETGWANGFGRQVLGETWVNHHGEHKVQGARTHVEKGQEKNAILNGVGEIFAESDVYGANPIQPSEILLRGEVTKTLEPDSAGVDAKNKPMQPVAWTREYKQESGKTNKIFTTTMGAASDLDDENLRRLVVNGVYWGLGMEIPKKADVSIKGDYNPTFYGFNTFKKQQTPSDYIIKEAANGETGSVRFIRIELPGQSRTLTLNEVEVISADGNIASKGRATQSSTHNEGTADRAIDAIKAPEYIKNGQTHTRDGGENSPWWELDLGASYAVNAVNVWNRGDGLEERLHGFTLSLLDKDKKVVAKKVGISAPMEAVQLKPNDKGELTVNYSAGVVKLPAVTPPKKGPKHPVAKPGNPPKSLELVKNSRIGLIGGGLASRMNMHHHFETELQLRNPELDLYIRNWAKEGDTPAFRPHPSRGSHWVIPNGRELVKEEFRGGGGQGHYETPDQWLKRHSIDTVIGFFGFSESFDGMDRIDGYKAELRAFIKHTLSADYTQNGPQLAIVSPAAFEDLSDQRDLPNGLVINSRLKAYAEAMEEVCKEEGILFVDAYSLTKGFYNSTEENLTANGHNLNDAGYEKLAPALADSLFGKQEIKADKSARDKVFAAVKDKNRLWLLDYKIPNGVHVHGRRYQPFGNENYPDELKKTRQMTAIRDKAIWALNKGNNYDVAGADAKTVKLKNIPSNSDRPVKYATGKEMEKKLTLPEGYEMKLFADEKMFPNLANPSQMAFDNKGRLWVSCMPSYPHYRIGDELPNDKILIYEDTNNDGKADKETIFVDHITTPMGFEITEFGVFVSLGNDLVLFKDTDGDDKADVKEYVLSGFDDHDTHHAISSFCADPSGAFYMGEGTFLHSNVETPYGPVRGTNGGFYRYNPAKGRLERTAQLGIPNPWGIAFDEWGQNFFLHTSGSSFAWMQQNAIKSRYNVNLAAPDLLTSNKVRPTSGVEFVSSRHFPDEVQGDAIICNNIGFLGAMQHKMMPDEGKAGFKTEFRQQLFSSSDPYFRPVDLEFAPDGSLYVIDWSNVLIGHMQHSARDPKRDHQHGRIYRITYPSRPLVPVAKVDGASIEQLLENLKLPEIRTRYRTRRELRGRDHAEVAAALTKWIEGLDKNDKLYEHNLTEAMWTSWGINQIDAGILDLVLNAKDYKARAAATRAVRYNADKLSDATALLKKSAADEHAQVRHEAIIAASWMGKKNGLEILDVVAQKPIDNWSNDAYKYARAHLTNEVVIEKKHIVEIPEHLAKSDKALQIAYQRGYEKYHEGESCASCHGADGEGNEITFIPPLDGSKWVTEDKVLLQKIAIHGVMGEIDVKGKKYQNAMAGFNGRVSNQDIADMLTYVRNAWSNKSGDEVTKQEVDDVQKATNKQLGPFKGEDLLKDHPIK